jgi:epoxyqueuosine reductase
VELTAPRLADLAALDDAAFRAVFSASPIKRIGRDRFMRNVLIAIGNSGSAELAGSAERLLADASPLVRGAAIWAMSRLLSAGEFTRLREEQSAGESDPAVREEWARVAHVSAG